MNMLDSRYLRAGDTFAQRFTEPGTYRYGVGIAGGLATPDHDAPFAIIVGDTADTAPTTHYVTVAFNDKAFVAAPNRLEIKRNDAVLWSGSKRDMPGFAIRGQNGASRFDSAEIYANGMYSHAFGTSGTFEWRDPREPTLHGTILVETHPPCVTHEHRLAYVQMLSKPTLVMIDEGRVRPSKVEITVGQTIFFAVKSAGGISIVDKALLLRPTSSLNPQPLPP